MSAEDETPFDEALLEGLHEAVAWKRGEIELPVTERAVADGRAGDGDPKERRKEPARISRRFGIPVRTLEGWEQGRRQPDPAASVMLRMIERNPKVVEEAVRES